MIVASFATLHMIIEKVKFLPRNEALRLITDYQPSKRRMMNIFKSIPGDNRKHIYGSLPWLPRFPRKALDSLPSTSISLPIPLSCLYFFSSYNFRNPGCSVRVCQLEYAQVVSFYTLLKERGGFYSDSRLSEILF